jgi:hypothetical protein
MAKSNLSYPVPFQSNELTKIPEPTKIGTACILTSIFFAFVTIQADALPSEMARQAAIPLGIGIVLSLWFDRAYGLKNLFRVDIVCLSALYFLTLFEFLYSQEGFNRLVTPEQAVGGLNTTLLGFTGLAIGRHFSILKPIPRKWLDFTTIPDRALFRIFLISSFLGYFYVLLTVDFDISVAMEEMIGPRFSQPWARGQYGGWSVLLSELSLLRYVIPPVAGIVMSRRKNFNLLQTLVVILVLAFSFYQAIASGTRLIFASYLVGFLAGYLLSLEQVKLWKLIVPTGAIGYTLVFASRHMLAFRNIGLERYIELEIYKETFEAAKEEGIAIDFNLWPISTIVDSMPTRYDFLGWELINVFATKPIPRALWPNKPEELSTSIEEILGQTQMTVATTYIGESYMVYGLITVFIFSLVIGATSNWWTRIIAQQSSAYAVIVGSLGFFVAGLAMRSLAFFSTTILPIIALIFFAKILPSWIGANTRKST